MAGNSSRGGSLKSIFLEDFSENKELADAYVDREGAAGGSFSDDESESIFMKRTEVEEELKRKDAVSQLFADDIDDEIPAEKPTPRTSSARVSNVKKPTDTKKSETGTEHQSGAVVNPTTSPRRRQSEPIVNPTSSPRARKSEPITNPTSSPRARRNSTTSGNSFEEGNVVRRQGSAESRTPSERTRQASLRNIQNDDTHVRREQDSYRGRENPNRRKVEYEKPKSTGAKVAKFAVFFVLWAVVVILCIVGYNTAYRIFNDKPIDPEDLSKIEITLTGKETDEEVGKILLENDLIDDLDTFKLRCKIYDAKYYPGTWKLSRSFNTEKNLNILAGYNYATGRMEEVTSEETTVAQTTTAETQTAETVADPAVADPAAEVPVEGDAGGADILAEGDGEYVEEGGEGEN